MESIEQNIAATSSQSPSSDSVDTTALKQETRLDFISSNFDVNVYKKLLIHTSRSSTIHQPNLSSAEQTKQAKQDAVKLTILFGTYEKAIQYLKDQDKVSVHSIHEHCRDLPTDYNLWRTLIDKHLPKPGFLKILKNADRIQAYVDKNKEILKKQAEYRITKSYEDKFRKEYEGLLTESKSTTITPKQQKEIDEEFGNYLKKKLDFPLLGKPTPTQLDNFKTRKKYLEEFYKRKNNS